MEFERKASGVAKGGLTTGIIGTSLGALALLGTGANGIGNLLGGGMGRMGNAGLVEACVGGAMMNALSSTGCGCARNSCGTCESDHFITRYDAEKDAEIAKLKSDIALRDADTYTDRKMLELYQYVDGRLRGIEGQIAQQAVLNQATNDKFQLAEQERACCCARLEEAIKAERDARCCGDNAIVSYVNSTFYPHLVADITAASTTTPNILFNPVSNCGCGCNG